jgi:hypothetical protein
MSTTDDPTVSLNGFVEDNAARVRAIGASDDELTADALAVFDRWTGALIHTDDVPPLVLHALAAAP